MFYARLEGIPFVRCKPLSVIKPVNLKENAIKINKIMADESVTNNVFLQLEIGTKQLKNLIGLHTHLGVFWWYSGVVYNRNNYKITWIHTRTLKVRIILTILSIDQNGCLLWWNSITTKNNSVTENYFTNWFGGQELISR